MNRQILLAFTLLFALTGCRLGNRVQKAAEPETYDGYYGTEAKTLEACVTFLNDDKFCVPVNLNQLPRDGFVSVFSNPVGLIVDETTGKGGFINVMPGMNLSLVTELKIPSLEIDFAGGAEDFDLLPTGNWLPTSANDCGVYLTVKETGQVTAEDKGKEVSDVTLSGRIDLKMTVEKQYFDIYASSPECLAALTFFEDCYKDPNLCQGTGAPQNTARQAEVASLYELFLNAGVMTSDDISDVKSREYTVTFK